MSENNSNNLPKPYLPRGLDQEWPKPFNQSNKFISEPSTQDSLLLNQEKTATCVELRGPYKDIDLPSLQAHLRFYGEVSHLGFESVAENQDQFSKGGSGYRSILRAHFSNLKNCSILEYGTTFEGKYFKVSKAKSSLRRSSLRGEDRYQIFVGNLPKKSFNIKLKLTQIFSNFGEVIRVQVCLPRTFSRERNSQQKNFGFVSYRTKKGMENALNFEQQLSIGNHYIFCDKVKRKKAREANFGESSDHQPNFQVDPSTQLFFQERRPASPVENTVPGSGQSHSTLDKAKRFSLGEQTRQPDYLSGSGCLQQSTLLLPESSKESWNLLQETLPQNNYFPQEFILTKLVESQVRTQEMVKDQPKQKKFGRDRENLVSYKPLVPPYSQRINQMSPNDDSVYQYEGERRNQVQNKKKKRELQRGGQHYMRYRYGPSDSVPDYSPYEEDYDYFDPCITGVTVPREQLMIYENANTGCLTGLQKLTSLDASTLNSIEQLFQCSKIRSDNRFQGDQSGGCSNDLNRVRTKETYD